MEITTNIKVWEVKEGKVISLYHVDKSRLLMLREPVDITNTGSLLDELTNAISLVEKYIGTIVKIDEDNDNKETKRNYTKVDTDRLLTKLKREIREGVTFSYQEAVKIFEIPSGSVIYQLNKMIERGDVIKINKGEYKLVKREKEIDIEDREKLIRNDRDLYAR